MASNVKDRLKESLPAHEWLLLRSIAGAATELGLPLYVVGGLPRDLLLGRPGSDFDLVVEGKANALARKLASRHGGKVVAHHRFGTAKWDLHGSSMDDLESAGGAKHDSPKVIDLISARSETYKHPAALPTVQLGKIEDDLRRRDFTINALAIRLDGPHLGELRDDLHGAEDLKHGLVKVLHERSFEDDPTRMYRAVRYEQRYRFRIADTTLDLIPGARELIGRLSAQRVRHELDLILSEERASAMLARLQKLDLLEPVHPSLAYDEDASERLRRSGGHTPFGMAPWPRQELRWVLWLMTIPAGQLSSVNRRLHFRASLFSSILGASTLQDELQPMIGASPSQWVETLDEKPLLAVYAAYLAAQNGPTRTALERYLAEWRHIKARTTGHDLKKQRIEPGPEYARILRELRRAWLDGHVKSVQQERQYLEDLISRQPRERVDR